MWPDYIPKNKRERVLSYLVEHRLITEIGEVFDIDSYEQLKSTMFDNNLDTYVYRFLGIHGFMWFNEAVNDPAATISIANSSGSIVSIAIKGPRGKLVKIISTVSWGWRKEPTPEFIKALRNVLDKFDYGIHPSPGSLGSNGLKQSFPEGKSRFSRPPNKLRNILFKYGSGGRADDFSTPGRKYDTVWESDFDNHYANQARGGVPAGRYRRYGVKGEFVDWNEFQDRHIPPGGSDNGGFTMLCECMVTVDQEVLQKSTYTSHSGKEVYVPIIYRRNEKGSEEMGRLTWIKEAGSYYGYYWYPMVQEMVRAGYRVRVGIVYFWDELDHFMDPFILHALDAREYFKSEGMRLEEGMCKMVIVSTFGRFGMRPYTLKLIPKSERQEGDIPFGDTSAMPCEGVSTEYFVRRIENENSPNLTQVMYYIIACANVAIYRWLLNEAMLGNELVASDYDAGYTVEYPNVTAGMKQKKHKNYEQNGLRSHDSNRGKVQPGLQKVQRAEKAMGPMEDRPEETWFDWKQRTRGENIYSAAGS